MFTACWCVPSQTARAASTVAPVTSADASCICGNTGLSEVPSPQRSDSRPITSSGARFTEEM